MAAAGALASHTATSAEGGRTRMAPKARLAERLTGCPCRSRQQKKPRRPFEGPAGLRSSGMMLAALLVGLLGVWVAVIGFIALALRKSRALRRQLQIRKSPAPVRSGASRRREETPRGARRS